MANEKYGSTALEQAPSVGVEHEDVFSAPTQQTVAPKAAARVLQTKNKVGALSPSESAHAFGEVAGDAVTAPAPIGGGESIAEAGALHGEVASPLGAEAGEDVAEATLDQIRAAM